MTTANIVPVSELGAVHFIGIGGAGMPGIARIVVMKGGTVTGSDAKEPSLVAVLRSLGATGTIGHSGDNHGEADALVISLAIRRDKPDVVEPQRRGLSTLQRC